MCPVITPESRARIESVVERAVREGARPVVDGRGAKIDGYAKGNFVRPTLLENLPLTSEIAGTEIFRPVLSLHHVDDIDAAIALVNGGRYGNQACLFTSNGASSVGLGRVSTAICTGRAGRVRVLHGGEGIGGAVAEGVVAEILRRAPGPVRHRPRRPSIFSRWVKQMTAQTRLLSSTCTG